MSKWLSWKKKTRPFLIKHIVKKLLKKCVPVRQVPITLCKPVTEENKKLISELFSKSVYLYDANTLSIIAKYDRHKDLVEELKISPKTLIKKIQVKYLEISLFLLLFL